MFCMLSGCVLHELWMCPTSGKRAWQLHKSCCSFIVKFYTCTNAFHVHSERVSCVFYTHLALILDASHTFQKCVNVTLELSCTVYHAAWYNLLNNFKLCSITKNARNFGRNLGAKFSLNDSQEMKLSIKAFLDLIILMMWGGMLICNIHASNTLLCQSYNMWLGLTKRVFPFHFFWLWKLITFFLDDLWQCILCTKYQQHSRVACENFNEIHFSLTYGSTKLHNWKDYKSLFVRPLIQC